MPLPTPDGPPSRRIDVASLPVRRRPAGTGSAVRLGPGRFRRCRSSHRQRGLRGA